MLRRRDDADKAGWHGGEGDRGSARLLIATVADQLATDNNAT
ncbi:hypothetical protein [Streptomyces sp. KLOTTS4A1]